MKQNSKIKYIICLIIFTILYTLRFTIGIVGFPGPYFGYINGANHLIWEFGFSSTGDLQSDMEKNYKDFQIQQEEERHKNTLEFINKQHEEWNK